MCLIYILGSIWVLERYVTVISIYMNSIELHVIRFPPPHLHRYSVVTSDCYGVFHYLHPLLITKYSHIALQRLLLYIPRRDA